MSLLLLRTDLPFTAPSRVLDHILSGRPTEEVVNEVHEYLTTIGNDLREGRVDLDDLVVHKVSQIYLLVSCSD